jgi:hypothetical protein
VIALGQRVEGVTSGSTDRSTPGCGARPGSPDDIWRFTPTSAGTFRIRVSARFDSVVALRDDSGTELACNDDQGAVGESEVVVGLAAGRTFEIVVDGYGGNHGAYSLVVDDFTASGGVAPGPPNLSTVTPAGALTMGRAVNETTLGGGDTVTPSCGSQPGTPDDVWTFVAPRRGPFVFDVDAQYDAVLALYDANGIELECNDDHGTTQRSRVQPRLERGQTYYVVVDGYAGNSGAYRLSVGRPRKPGR